MRSCIVSRRTIQAKCQKTIAMKMIITTAAPQDGASPLRIIAKLFLFDVSLFTALVLATFMFSRDSLTPMIYRFLNLKIQNYEYLPVSTLKAWVEWSLSRKSLDRFPQNHPSFLPVPKASRLCNHVDIAFQASERNDQSRQLAFLKYASVQQVTTLQCAIIRSRSVSGTVTFAQLDFAELRAIDVRLAIDSHRIAFGTSVPSKHRYPSVIPKSAISRFSSQRK